MSNFCNRFIVTSPICAEVISVRPRNWISRSMRPTSFLKRSAVMGRFSKDLRRPISSLSRLYGSRRPSRFTTIKFRISTSSIVENRCPHRSHSRRRRMENPSSVRRESRTLVSSWWQDGHFIRILGSNRSGQFGQNEERRPYWRRQVEKNYSLVLCSPRGLLTILVQHYISYWMWVRYHYM